MRKCTETVNTANCPQNTECDAVTTTKKDQSVTEADHLCEVFIGFEEVDMIE